ANNNYYLLTNGVWTGVLQSGTGSPLTFPPQTVLTVPLTNTVLASNTTTAATGLMLGSALVAPNAPPVITNQPTPSVVANGSIGVFNVAASGGGLTYQWFKNGSPLSNGGNITGATNSTLAISPVGAGDVANYFVTVTSGCLASTNSTTNGLSIDSPANLTWQGNNPNSNWDLSTTANFNTGPAVVFHNGDNVTFDDTALTPTVNVVGNFIAPGTMTENSAGTYTLNGPGTIQGPGHLVMNGSGLLNLNGSNAYTGGTIINSGTVVLNNGSFASAGTGTITLAGGILDIPTKAASANAWSNNINVTADSTLQFDQNGTEACILDGIITGNSGTTLTVHASTNGSTTARLRFYGVFTNNANIAFSPQVAETELAPYNPAGNQIYNGIISGTTGRITARGAGNAVLANQNTFNDLTSISFPFGASLLMSSGNIGIGADSVQSSPPTIDSSPVGTGYIALNVGNEGGNCSFFSWGGAHTIANQMQFTSTSNTIELIISGTNDLTFSGEFDIALASDPTGTNRTIEVTNTGATTFSGMITDNSAINTSTNGIGASTSGITKTGSGSLYLNGTNVYLGPTTNNGGLLAGSGYIAGPVIVVTNGTIGGGSAASIGTLTLSNSLTINGGVSVRVNKSLGQTSDLISVMGALANAGTGTVTVNNLGSALVAGDTFHIFNKLVTGGGSLTITGGGAGVIWNNNLGVDGSISVQSVGPSGPTTNATITHVSLSGTNLVIHGTNNNVPNTSFHFEVFTTTNVATPLSSWTPGATLPFNADGTFDYTNPIVPGTPRQFIDVKAVP
ncbi:MAG TPA: immunoglobulin domain-containing protein, partial [Verrucomicrobiae bacterium]|nr:immunoglobulin domain-containing protein [Verrucomicrobiae bacterium]